MNVFGFINDWTAWTPLDSFKNAKLSTGSININGLYKRLDSLDTLFPYEYKFLHMKN
jgi:hypothetical protein